MPSALKSFEEFDALLTTTRKEIEAMMTVEPDEPAIRSVHLQLEALFGWTRGGRCPDQSEKDRLNFGAIASRELDVYPVANSLYELSSYVIFWE